MALDKASLKTRIKTNLTTLMTGIGFTVLNSTQLDLFAQAIADAVVDEIQANATVSVTGVQTGGGSASGTVS